MSYKIEVTALFEKQVKKLAKKFPSLKKEFAQLIVSLKENPQQGTPISNHCYKIRLAIASKGKGKRGGARVITHIQVINNKIFLLTIYDKSELENLTDKEIESMIKLIP
ncbi:type II toxin-antitoxin system RelE/ParE family toxin [uncultured Cytophaga sp.]|uniref:type II toxin-antitoxin system RelE/ParE family toxin n=1 Tax=uncultured Cytophaga sp. TaxID=160238 RepID=UPI002614FBD4|nr:type II toxin-antitoxin system RelE/ParE family toxin [uncultured Cytophaga sp.]